MSRTRSTEAIGAAEKVSQWIHAAQRAVLRRWFATFIETRTQKAEREIREHLRFLTDDMLGRAGYQGSAEARAAQSPGGSDK